MKKLTVILIATLLGLAMSSCTPKESAHEKIMKQCNEFFTNLENEVKNVSNIEEFMEFLESSKQKKADISQVMFADYCDKDGNIIGIDSNELEKIQNDMYERATAYNHVEAAKYSEIFAEDINNYENILNTIYNKLQNEEVPTDEEIEAYYEAEERLGIFGDYDNVPPDVTERFDKMSEKMEFVRDIMYE